MTNFWKKSRKAIVLWLITGLPVAILMRNLPIDNIVSVGMIWGFTSMTICMYVCGVYDSE